MKYYLLIIHGDVESEAVGPFEASDERDSAALEHRRNDPGRDDGLHRLNVSPDGTIDVSDYSGGFFEEVET